MKKSQNKELEDWAFKYDALENFCETLERFGLGNPGRCDDCNDYGCSAAIERYINRITGTDSNYE